MGDIGCLVFKPIKFYMSFGTHAFSHRNRPSLLMKRKNDNSLLQYLSFHLIFFSDFAKLPKYVCSKNKPLHSATMIDSLDGGENSTVIA